MVSGRTSDVPGKRTERQSFTLSLAVIQGDEMTLSLRYDDTGYALAHLPKCPHGRPRKRKVNKTTRWAYGLRGWRAVECQANAWGVRPIWRCGHCLGGGRHR
jgi:hypothetical protein